MDSTPLHTYNVAEEFSIFYSEHEAGQHAIPQDVSLHCSSYFQPSNDASKEMAEDYSVSEIIQDQAHYTVRRRLILVALLHALILCTAYREKPSA